MLSKRWCVVVGVAITMLGWSSATKADELLPPSGDVWITSEMPRYVREQAATHETVILGDVWLDLPGRENAIAMVPRRATTGMGGEGRR